VLADLLWDNRTQRRTQGNLRVVLSSLKKQVGEFVLIERDTIHIRPNAHI
jgi:DNA-binding SARP family transcriptional activator